MDFEDMLDIFFVRKENDIISFNLDKTNYKSSYQPRNVFACIPVMLTHIKKINIECSKGPTNVYEMFSGRIRFRNCIVYGKIMGRGNDSKLMFNYLLDDGTDCLNISVPRKTEDMEAIRKLESELQAIRKNTVPSRNEHQIVQCLRNILFRTKEQIDQSNLANGTKVFLFGKPNIFRGRISLNVFCLAEDNTIDRDAEIAFKDFLIDWFRKNIL